jgi:hypothetical protein
MAVFNAQAAVIMKEDFLQPTPNKTTKHFEKRGKENIKIIFISN